MSNARYPLTVALPDSQVRHAARTIGTGYLVLTACAQRGEPTGDGAGLPHCTACATVSTDQATAAALTARKLAVVADDQVASNGGRLPDGPHFVHCYIYEGHHCSCGGNYQGDQPGPALAAAAGLGAWERWATNTNR